MRLEKLYLFNFKNYGSCSISFCPGLNFIFGDNGNGKTNILESISFLSYTKSFLQNSDSDCLKYGESEFEIKGSFINDLDTEFKMQTEYNTLSPGKTFFLNNSKINRLNDILGLFPLVTLSPYDLKLTTGAPYERRRNFDLLISQTSRVYLEDIRNLSRIIKQKNSLLKENLIYKKHSPADLKNMISIWNDELAGTGIKVLIRRLDFIDSFRELLKNSLKELVDEKYDPIIELESDLLPDDNEHDDIDRLADVFRNDLENKYELEVRRGISLTGPQRDNYVFRMKKGTDVFDVRTVASQGEHKMFIIALKLAEFKYIKRFGETSSKGDPVFLLDDVFSELDRNKVNRLSEILPEYNQIFITTTEQEYGNKLKGYFKNGSFKSFEISNGAVLNAD